MKKIPAAISIRQVTQGQYTKNIVTQISLIYLTISAIYDIRTYCHEQTILIIINSVQFITKVLRQRLILILSLNFQFQKQISKYKEIYAKMNMFCCQDTTINRRNYNSIVYNEFIHRDPVTKQITKQIVPFQENRTYEKYKNWQRIKVQSIDYADIYKQLKQDDTNFQDLSFPHNNQSITHEYDQKKIKWARVIQIIDDAVYSKQHTAKSLEKFNCSNKQLQNALVLISRTHPEKFKEILTKTLSPYGIYEFRLYKDGKIENVVIDDFVPVFNKIPMFTGPVRGKQVYPMLLEKAIAKLYGNYESVPTDCQTLMETIFCGAVRKKNFSSIQTRQQVITILQQGLQKNGLIILLSKFDSKVRNYGISENEIYQVIASHEIEVKGSPVKLYECLTQTRMNAWNGKFNVNDEIWKAVDPQTKSYIFNQLKKNKSFCICEQDIPRIFQELMIFEDTNTSNKDWIQSSSETDIPSFIKFSLEQEDRVFIRVIGPNRFRQSIILTRIHEGNQVEYIGGAIQMNERSTEFSKLLEPGDYVICSLQEWVLDRAGEYRVFLSSSTYTSLERIGNFIPNFFENMFFNHSFYTQGENKIDKIYSYCMLVYEIGLAYLHIRAQNTDKKTIKVLIDEKKLKEENWSVLQPKGVKQIQITKISNKNNDKIIVLKCDNFRLEKKVIFPSMAFKIQQ